MSIAGITVYPRGKVYYTELNVDDRVVKRSTRVPVTASKEKALKAALAIREDVTAEKTAVMTLSQAIDKAHEETGQ